MTQGVDRWINALTPARTALLAWLLACVGLLVAHWASLAGLRTVDPDDALRLVQVRDLIGGQGWWDVSQHRINPAGGGGLMHWSRIVDAPIALAIAALAPIAGTARAEIIVLTLWPLLLLGGLFWAAARAFSVLAPARLVALTVAMLATDYVILFQFAPLRIDHHGWQILLSLLMLWPLLRVPTPRAGAAAGIAGASLVAISLEGLPMIALVGAVMAAAWAWTGAAALRLRLVAYLVTLPAGAALLQLVTRGPSALVQTWCDSLSLPYLAALAVAAAAVAIGSMLTPRARDTVVTRGLVLAVAAVAAGAALLLAGPGCAAGPFGTLDPVVVHYWYNNVHEGRPIWTDISPMFAFALVPMLIGLVGAIWAWRHADDDAQRRVWLTVLAMQAGTMLLALLVLRTASVAHLFAMPGCAWLVWRCWRWARALDGAATRILATLGVIGLLPPFAGAAFGVALRDTPASTSASGADALNAETCVDGAGAAALNQLAPVTIMAPLDIGPHLLQRTHHSVTATGHHRNNRVMAQTIMAYIGDPAAARGRAKAMGASMIVMCPRANETGNFRLADGDGLADLLMTGRTPAWLEPVVLPAGSNLKAWRIR